MSNLMLELKGRGLNLHWTPLVFFPNTINPSARNSLVLVGITIEISTLASSFEKHYLEIQDQRAKHDSCNEL